MYTLKDLSVRYDLSPKQARRYFESVSQLIAPHCQRGPHNTTLVSEQAIPVFDRLLELMRNGLGLPAAAQQIVKEMNGIETANGKLTSSSGETVSSLEKRVYRDELVDELRTQVQELRRERDRLINLLESSQDQVRQLMLPSPKSNASLAPNRWQAVKILVLGR